MRTILILLFCIFNLPLTCEPVTQREDNTFFYISEFNQDHFKTVLFKTVLFPETIYALSILETGNFSSRIFKENNNPFGMRLAKVRETTAVGEANHFAVYNHWISAIEDLRLWQDYYLSRGHGLNDMIKIYCPDKDYRKKVMNIKKII